MNTLERDSAEAVQQIKQVRLGEPFTISQQLIDSLLGEDIEADIEMAFELAGVGKGTVNFYEDDGQLLDALEESRGSLRAPIPVKIDIVLEGDDKDLIGITPLFVAVNLSVSEDKANKFDFLLMTGEETFTGDGSFLPGVDEGIWVSEWRDRYGITCKIVVPRDPQAPLGQLQFIIRERPSS